MEDSQGMNLHSQSELDDLKEKQKIIDLAPFCDLKISDSQILNTVEGREICGNCFKSRKFFCYTCYSLVIDQKHIPRVKLPIRIDIIKHAREVNGKSTAVHAAVLAPENVRIYTYPDFPEITNDRETVLIFPSKNAIRVNGLLSRDTKNDEGLITERIQNELPITRAIFIDSTWHQTKAIYKDPRLRGLRCVILKSRISQFWRHQKESPRWYLATIEAIHQFLVELHTCVFGVADDTNLNDNDNNLEQPYCGQYDNLLFFFKYMYEKIHSIYDHEQLWAYKRPLF